jgi:hypothetical protein
MKPDSNERRKAANGKKRGQRRWIVDWSIESAATSGYVNLSLYVAGESDDSVCSSTTRHYLLQRDRIVELIRELNGTLEHSNASRLLEKRARKIDRGTPKETDPVVESAEREQPDLTLNHFSLGAYGLVGN